MNTLWISGDLGQARLFETKKQSIYKYIYIFLLHLSSIVTQACLCSSQALMIEIERNDLFSF